MEYRFFFCSNCCNAVKLTQMTEHGEEVHPGTWMSLSYNTPTAFGEPPSPEAPPVATFQDPPAGTDLH